MTDIIISNKADIILTPDAALASPVVVIPAATVEYVTMLTERIKGLKVDTPEAFAEASSNLNKLGKSRKAVRDSAAEKARPFDAEADRIRAEAKPLLTLIMEAEKTVGDDMTAYSARVKAEAELKRKEAEAERAREQAEADRLAKEAAKRMADGEAELEAATSEAAFEVAGETFRAGAEVQRVADLAAAYVPKPVVIAAPVLATKGVKTKREAVLDSVDLALLPVAYRVADEVKIRKHLLDGLTIEGVKWHEKTSFVGTGK